MSYQLLILTFVPFYLTPSYRWFDSSHVHGTIMPRQSTVLAARLRGGANSRGVHKAYPKRTAKRAAARKVIRANHANRTEIWAGEI